MKTVHPALMYAALSAALLTTGLGLSPAARAVTWDLTADFPGSSNPNGVWTYGWEAANGLNGTLTLYDTLKSNRQWYDANHHSSGPTPTIWRNDGGSILDGVAPGEVSLHPGWDHSFSVARWTSPTATSVDVNGFFGAGDLGHESYYIAIDGVTQQSWLSDPGTENFSLTRSVSVGTTIDFIVGVPIGGDYYFGNTPLKAVITTAGAVPEPNTAALLLTGLGLVGTLARRRKRAS